jgi:hypothetical protein
MTDTENPHEPELPEEAEPDVIPEAEVPDSDEEAPPTPGG